MNDITNLLGDLYLPQKALVVYRHMTDNSQVYVEAYDMDGSGKPINAHPLAVEECRALAKALETSEALQKDFLKSGGLLPGKVLYLNMQHGFALWHTPPQQVGLLFRESLNIPCGKAHIPAMIWKADKESLQVFAVKGKHRPEPDTALFHAPYFNLYEDGMVCMGTVDVAIENDCCLEDFMSQWENYFFGSYFSHMIQGSIPVKENIVQLWQQQVVSGKPFPEDILVKTMFTIKDLIK